MERGTFSKRRLLLVILHGPEIERQWREEILVFAVRTPKWAGDEDGESV